MSQGEDPQRDHPPVPMTTRESRPASREVAPPPRTPPEHDRPAAGRAIDGQAGRLLERLHALERDALVGEPFDLPAIVQAGRDIQDLQLAIMGAVHGWEHPDDQRALEDAGRSISLAASVIVDLVERLTPGRVDRF